MSTLWLTGYPFISANTTGTTVISSGSINQSGMIKMVILPSASGIPSAANIYAGNNASGNAVPTGFSDYEEASASGVDVNLTGYGLSSETAYKMHIVASGYDDGLMASGWSLPFTTPDITKPAWVSYSIANIYPTSGEFALSVGESLCSGFVLVLASGSSAPTASAIRTSGTVVDMATASTVYNVTVTSLYNLTDYTAYAAAQDEVPNLQSTGVLIGSFTTPQCGMTATAYNGVWNQRVTQPFYSGIAHVISGLYNANDIIIIATANTGAPSGIVSILAGNYDQACAYTSPSFSGTTYIISDIQGVRVQRDDGNIVLSGTISGLYSVVDVKHGRGA